MESITRLAAFTVARSLRRAGLPVVLIASGDKSGGGETVRELESASDLVDIWTQRTLKPSNPPRSLKLASAIRSTLRDGGGLKPAILLLTHPWFGAEDPLPSMQNLRGLFVQYPNYQTHPALAEACERWRSVSAGEITGLEKTLGHLIG